MSINRKLHKTSFDHVVRAPRTDDAARVAVMRRLKTVGLVSRGDDAGARVARGGDLEVKRSMLVRGGSEGVICACRRGGW